MESGATAPVSWANVAFGMAVYNSDAEARLVQAAADTWLRMAQGADLVLMTDVDDPRNASTIAPRLPFVAAASTTAATSGAAAAAAAAATTTTVAPLGVVHVLRCAECRGQRCDAPSTAGGAAGCDGVREGWLARRKVLHLFVAMARLYGVPRRRANEVAAARGGSVEPSPSAKHFFLKLDPDTVPVPHHMLSLLTELHLTLGPTQPYLFGMAACRVASFPLCHASGGAGYGLSRGALSELTKYVASSYPDFLQRVDRFTYGGEDVAVAFALKKQSGVAVVNVGCMYQHEPLKYRRLHAKGDDWVRWPLTTTPVSFHKFKDAAELRAFFACALYDLRSGKPRPAPRALFALDASVANASRSGRAASMAASCGAPAEQEWEKPEEGVGGANAAPRHRIRAAAHARVNDGGITRIGSKGSKDVQGGQTVA